MDKDNKKFIVETVFLKETLKRDLSLKEFIVLMYFDNEYEQTFDVKKVAKATCLSEQDVLTCFGNLMEKKLITINPEKDNRGKLIEKVSLENLYKDIKESESKKKEENSREDFYNKFQANYGHNLTGMDLELINAWLSSGYSEEIILGALKEANYNGVATLRYIDKVLFEWKKKGFKDLKDVDNHIKQRSEDEDPEELYETKVFDYNWLDED